MRDAATTPLPRPASRNPHEYRVAPTAFSLLSLLVPGSWAALLVVFLVVVPKLFEIFRDFGVALSTGTILTLSFARWLGGEQPGQMVPGAVLMIPVLLLMCGLVPLSMLRATRRPAITVSVLLLLLAMLVLLGLVVTLFIPLVSMAEAMQAGGP